MPSPLQIPQAPKNPELDPLDPNASLPTAVVGKEAPTDVVPAAPTPVTEGPAADLSLSAIAKPISTDIDPSKDTVEGRVSDIISTGSPLQQIAKTQAKQEMQQKGLLNTSMAIGAGQKAVMEQALSIAKPDALYAQQINLQREKEDIDKRMLTASADEQIRLIAKKSEVDTALQELSGTQALEQIGARGEVEADLIARRGEIETMLQTADSETRSRLIEEQGALELELVKARGVEELSLRDRQAEIDNELETLRAGFKTGDLAAQQLHETELNNERMALEERLLEMQGDQNLVLQNLQGEQAVALEDIRGYYDGIINTQRNAAVLYNTTQQTIAELLTNPDLSPDDRSAAIQYQIDNLNASLSVLGTMGGVDVSDILGIAPPTTQEPSTLGVQAGPGDIGGSETIVPPTEGVPSISTQGELSFFQRIEDSGYKSRSGLQGLGGLGVSEISGTYEGKDFNIKATNEIMAQDPSFQKAHEDSDVFIGGLGWIPLTAFIE